MNLLKLKELVPKEFHAEIDRMNSDLERLKLDNLLLSNHLSRSEEQAKELNNKIKILMVQTDEWVKSYNRLLEDFLFFKKQQKNKD